MLAAPCLGRYLGPRLTVLRPPHVVFASTTTLPTANQPELIIVHRYPVVTSWREMLAAPFLGRYLDPRLTVLRPPHLVVVSITIPTANQPQPIIVGHHLMSISSREALGTDINRERCLVGTVLQHVMSGLIQCERGICHPLTGDDIPLPIRAILNIGQITIGLSAAEKRHTTG